MHHLDSTAGRLVAELWDSDFSEQVQLIASVWHHSSLIRHMATELRGGLAAAAKTQGKGKTDLNFAAD